jgi:hypothetical protein
LTRSQDEFVQAASSDDDVNPTTSPGLSPNITTAPGGTKEEVIMSVRSRLTTLAAVATLAAAVGATSPPTTALATSPHTIDPATLQPALNPDFAPWSCWEAGTGIVCQGQYDDAWTDDPIGLECNGQSVHSTGTRHEQMTRWHTSAGLATRTNVHLRIIETLSLDSDGSTARSDGNWNRLYSYPVPGDRDSRILTEVGAYWLLRAPGKGTTFVDAGVVDYAPGEEFEEIAGMSGRHDFFEDPAAIDQAICDALN